MLDKHSTLQRVGSKLLFVAFLGLLLVATGKIAQAQTETVLYAFCSQPNCADGISPNGDLARDAKGNLYGSTFAGGTSGFCLPIAYTTGCGILFEITPDGTEKVLYTFMGGADGGHPNAGVIRGEKGDLYGTTDYGGYESGGCRRTTGCGAVFEGSPNGSEKALYSFEGKGDGGFPNGSLLLDDEGNLYGITFLASDRSPEKQGVVFMLAPDGTETVLHTFQAYKGDGEHPIGNLVMDAQGNLYGTTEGGGHYGYYGPPDHANPCYYSGCGTVFEISTGGEERILYAFKGWGHGDGAIPYALVIDAQGNIYGLTEQGGIYGYGSIFEITAAGAEKQLYSFTSGEDGAYPTGLVLGGQGNLFGTAVAGGTYGDGTVFEFTSSGTLEVLHNFAGVSDGEAPEGLLRDAHGNLYGTTTYGGNVNSTCFAGCGVVFMVTP